MRVLWFSVTPSLYEEKKYGGWIASLERIINKYGADIELGIAFEYETTKVKVNRHGTTYYPFYVGNSITSRLLEKVDCYYKWRMIKNKLLSIIEDFKPDIIQCFGSEWPYGLITEDINIPVIIHMQGFLNIYNESSNMVISKKQYLKYSRYNPKIVFTELTNSHKEAEHLKRELHIMDINRYFIGRTQWDKNIVKFYSPHSKYFYCAEALRPEIYYSSYCWESNHKNVLITISQAGVLKGNEIILKTAKILKEQFNFEFEWRVAGNKEALTIAERKLGIRHEDYNIKLLGMIDVNGVARELASATIYIHPAIIDNSPNSLCEAQVIGCPIIAANVGGISSLVDDEKTGVLYPYNEPHTLAFKIMDLCCDNEKRKSLSNNEILMAKKRHNPEIIYQTLSKIYRDIID